MNMQPCTMIGELVVPTFVRTVDWPMTPWEGVYDACRRINCTGRSIWSP